MMKNLMLDEAIRINFDESMTKNGHTENDRYEIYIQSRNKIIYDEMQKCTDRQNIEDVVDAVLKAQSKILFKLNKKLGLSSPNQDFDELLLDAIAEIFCENLGYDKNDIISKAYYKGGGTSPMVIKSHKLEPISTPCSRLHNWICRQKIEIGKLSEIIDETKDGAVPNSNSLREVLNGQCDITLEILFRMIAIPLDLDSIAFKILAYEVLQDEVDSNVLKSICALLWDINSDLENVSDRLPKTAEHPARPKSETRPTVCIIGASGFIGSNLIRKIGETYRLVLQFHQRPTEDMIHGIPDDSLIYIGDLKNEELTKRIFLENDIDFAFWLAASSTQQLCEDYLSAYDMNVDYLKCLFKLLAKKTITLKGLLLPSTCMLYMYDTSDKTIYKETDLLTCKNLPPYALTKKRLEDFALDIAENHDVNIIIARMSQVYGPGDTSARLIPQSIANIYQERALNCAINTIGNSPCVNFIYIDDIVNAFKHICESVLEEKYDFDEGRIINLAGKRTYTVLEVLGILKDVFNSDVEIQKNVEEKLNVKIYAIDTSLAEKKAGLKPQFSLKERLSALNRQQNLQS